MLSGHAVRRVVATRLVPGMGQAAILADADRADPGSESAVGAAGHFAMRLGRASVTATVIIVAGVGVASATLRAGRGPTASAAACRVTIPNGQTPPHERPNKSYHGADGLWVGLELDGRVTVEGKVGQGVGLQQDGSIQWKYPWFGDRSAGRTLAMTVRSVYSPAKRGRAQVRQGAQSKAPRFWSSYAEFPSPGCWRVTGRAGRSKLTFVVLVNVRA